MKNQAIPAGTLGMLLVLTVVTCGHTEDENPFQFFQEEAKVVTASRQPQSREQAPAMVYVVTSNDIKDSGASTIWEALRSVPGVDVMQTRTGQAEVSIRGLNQTLNNRTLVLLDGKTVMNGFFDYVTWESIPVTLDEVDRIEVVEGPSSAIYGGNAVNGVINIITKKPDQLRGGIVRYTTGEREFQGGNFAYGDQKNHLSYKLGGGWTSTNRFENAAQLASQAGKFDSAIGYAFSNDSEWNVSGGFTHLNTQTTLGPVGDAYDKGFSGFLRSDYRFQNTRVRTFWNRGRTRLDQLQFLSSPNVNYDTIDTSVEQSVALPWRNQAVFGASYRKNSTRSSALEDGLLTQDLWSMYGEDRWDIADHWAFMASGRVDRHPFTPITFSPRGSLLYTPVAQQVVRVSGGTSFRNPTLTEDYLNATVATPNPGTAVPNPPITTLETHIVGNRSLDPERMEMVEISHDGTFGRMRTTVGGFHYKLSHVIQSGILQTTVTPPSVDVWSSYDNGESISASGGELGLELALSPAFTSFANYSYQYLHDDSADHYVAVQSPRHKANAGLRYKKHGITGNLVGHWVDKTQWASTLAQGTPGGALLTVNSYFLVDAHAAYAFSGRWDGFEIGVTVANLLNHDHYEILPFQNAAVPGQNGEIIRQRWTGTMSYKF